MPDDYYPEDAEDYTAGWSAEKCAIFREDFLEFLNHVTVNSKEKGPIILGEHVYRAQLRFLDAILKGLSEGKHDFKVLKSRQLGITTFARALTLFWNGIHSGLKGYMTFDTGDHKEEARLELVTMVKSLPDSLGFPRIKRENRTLMELSNSSTMNFASAGVRESKSSGTLGRSSGINFSHNSEICSWNNTEGIEAYKNAMAEDFPDRLYIWESTARGFNKWWEMWEEAKADPEHQVTIFLGWWAKDNQRIPRNHPDFEHYGALPPTVAELKKIKAVKDQYDWDITPEQLAWIRRKMDPGAKSEGDAAVEFEGDSLRIQEQPWTEQEAFQQSGSTFFEPEVLTDITNKYSSNKFQSYTYTTGLEFAASSVHKSYNTKSIQLKVWEEPDPEGVYVIAADPAFGISEFNDRSAIQVLRCYADCVEQVAEYAWPLVNTRQFAWVIATLLGWYGECHLILELSGPGDSVWRELQDLKRMLSQGYQPKETEEKGLKNIFANVKNYLYGRSDSLTPGRALQLKTTAIIKIPLMERLRDFVSHNGVIIRSMATIEELKSISREGDTIEASGSGKDDRVMSLAMGVRCWEEKIRRRMAAERKTRDNEMAKRRLTVRDQAETFMNHQLTSFFARKERTRKQALLAARQQSWRRGRR